MKQIITFFILLCSCNALIMAQQLQPLSAALEALQPQTIFPSDINAGYRFTDNTKGPKPATSNLSQMPDGSGLLTTEVFSAGKSHYEVQSSWSNTAAITKGDVLLARFTIRSIYAKQESGEAVVYFFVQEAAAPYTKSVIVDLSAGPEWKTIDIPFVAANDLGTGKAAIAFSFGALPQKVEISSIQVLNFKQTATLAQLPITKFTYAGRNKDAVWRKDALQRIAAIRTAPLIIQVKDAKGKPVSGATVTARLIDPQFIFGTAVSVNLITGADADAVKYKALLPQLFNAVTIDNNLKWPLWRNLQAREKTKTAIAWILNNKLRLRGHNLVWPGRNFTPSPFKEKPDFGPSFADSITDHIKDIVSYTKGKVYGWDVINEMVHEKDYFNVMPRTQAAEWFKLARKYDPKATLFINEYAMLNSTSSPQAIQAYLDVIKELRGYGAPIDAIGVQGHIGRQPRSPAEVISDLDLFKITGLPVQITEFDINTPDEELQADYTRDFLIACYSHPLVNGFTMWGFWEPAHWKPDAAMYKKDWTAKPNAAVWEDLVLKQWRTNISQSSNTNGEVNSSGHLGRYEITVTKGGESKKIFYQLTKNTVPAEIKL